MRIKCLPFFAKKGVTIHAFFSRSIIKKTRPLSRVFAHLFVRDLLKLIRRFVVVPVFFHFFGGASAFCAALLCFFGGRSG